MAVTIPQTVQDIMNAVYTQVDDNPSSALTQDSEYTARLNLINMGILNWASEDVEWKELWAKYTFSSTITTSQTYSITATDFLQPGSLLTLTGSDGSTNTIDIITPQQAVKYVGNMMRQACFITGNPSIGFTLNLTWAPVAGDNIYGTTPSFYYYKSPIRVALTTDIPEMSDPNYLIWFVISQKQLFNNRTDLASDALARAQNCLDNMKIRNEMVANYQDNTLEDVDLMRYGDSLGY